MSALWTSNEAAAATGGSAKISWQATGVSIDSRSLTPGDLFVALTDQRDGHDFVADALARGAAAALVSRRPEGVAPDAPLLLVEDVQRALEDLGRAARARTEARVVAVTGSVGKTSTKEMLRSALAGQGRVHAAYMSLNNHWGVPLTLARMPADTDYAVLEIGMNHAGEIAPLSRLARPDVALVTNVAPVHMAAFGSISDIARAKAELFEGLTVPGTAILNRDQETFGLLADAARAKGAKVVTFGADSAAGFRLLSAHTQDGVTMVKARLTGTEALLKINAPGLHFACNAMAVLAAIEALGADTAIGALDLAQWRPPAGRGARHRVNLDPVEENCTLDLIDDAYNANPTSMGAALAVLADSHPVDGIGRIRKGRRLAILTDMLELGESAPARHAALADLPQMQRIDTVHCAGPLMRSLFEALPIEKRGEWHDSAEKLAARVHHLLDAGDVVMVKGSKGSRAALVVEAILRLGVGPGARPGQAGRDRNKG